jgi:hypothetical protein
MQHNSEALNAKFARVIEIISLDRKYWENIIDVLALGDVSQFKVDLTLMNDDKLKRIEVFDSIANSAIRSAWAIFDLYEKGYIYETLPILRNIYESKFYLEYSIDCDISHINNYKTIQLDNKIIPIKSLEYLLNRNAWPIPDYQLIFYELLDGEFRKRSELMDVYGSGGDPKIPLTWTNLNACELRKEIITKRVNWQIDMTIEWSSIQQLREELFKQLTEYDTDKLIRKYFREKLVKFDNMNFEAKKESLLSHLLSKDIISEIKNRALTWEYNRDTMIYSILSYHSHSNPSKSSINQNVHSKWTSSEMYNFYRNYKGIEIYLPLLDNFLEEIFTLKNAFYSELTDPCYMDPIWEYKDKFTRYDELRAIIEELNGLLNESY